jgi:hypothetical protein
VRRRFWMFVSAALLVATAGAHAQEKASSPAIPLKVQVVLSRYDGERKLASMPYTLLVNAGDRDNRVTLRLGVALPVTATGKDGPTVSVYDVGTNMDCTATVGDAGPFKIILAVNHTSVLESDQKQLQAAVPRPGATAQLLRSFTSSFSLNLKTARLDSRSLRPTR